MRVKYMAVAEMDIKDFSTFFYSFWDSSVPSVHLEYVSRKQGFTHLHTLITCTRLLFTFLLNLSHIGIPGLITGFSGTYLWSFSQCVVLKYPLIMVLGPSLSPLSQGKQHW